MYSNLLRFLGLVTAIFMLYVNAIFAEFKIRAENYPTLAHSNLLSLGPILSYSNVPFNLRSPNDKNPGDYFYSPMTVDAIILENSIRAEIHGLLSSFIDTAFFSDYIISRLSGFSYQLCDQCGHRKEFHIRYSRGDTLYVISGWIGKFISFYRAVPGDFKLSIRQLQNEIAKLSPSYQIADSNAFIVKNTRSGYFCKRVDKQNMVRVRNYTITEVSDPRNKQDMNQSWTYNLIEITKFLDKEMIP